MAGLVRLPHRAINIENIAERALRVDVGGEDAAIGTGPADLAGAQQHRAGAVTEQHAGAAVPPVEDARVDLAADHQRGARLADPDHRVGDRQRIDEAAARGRQVEAEAARAQFRLHAQRGRRKRLVGRGGGQDDGVHLAAVATRRRASAARAARVAM